VRVGGDAGDPVVVSDPTSVVAQRLSEVAGRVVQRLAIRSFAPGRGGLPVLQ